MRHLVLAVESDDAQRLADVLGGRLADPEAGWFPVVAIRGDVAALLEDGVGDALGAVLVVVEVPDVGWEAVLDVQGRRARFGEQVDEPVDELVDPGDEDAFRSLLAEIRPGIETDLSGADAFLAGLGLPVDLLEAAGFVTFDNELFGPITIVVDQANIEANRRARADYEAGVGIDYETLTTRFAATVEFIASTEGLVAAVDIVERLPMLGELLAMVEPALSPATAFPRCGFLTLRAGDPAELRTARELLHGAERKVRSGEATWYSSPLDGLRFARHLADRGQLADLSLSTWPPKAAAAAAWGWEATVIPVFNENDFGIVKFEIILPAAAARRWDHAHDLADGLTGLLVDLAAIPGVTCGDVTGPRHDENCIASPLQTVYGLSMDYFGRRPEVWPVRDYSWGVVLCADAIELLGGRNRATEHATAAGLRLVASSPDRIVLRHHDSPYMTTDEQRRRARAFLAPALAPRPTDGVWSTPRWMFPTVLPDDWEPLPPDAGCS